MHLTEAKCNTIAHALRVAADKYDENATWCKAIEQPKLADTFIEQAKVARALAVELEDIDHEPDTVERARDEHQREGECEIDEDATVSRGNDGGAYVQAWVGVADPSCMTCGEAKRTAKPRPTSDEDECDECYQDGLKFGHEQGLHSESVADCPLCPTHTAAPTS